MCAFKKINQLRQPRKELGPSGNQAFSSHTYDLSSLLKINLKKSHKEEKLVCQLLF
jgi:hypothetical protein